MVPWCLREVCILGGGSVCYVLFMLSCLSCEILIVGLMLPEAVVTMQWCHGVYGKVAIFGEVGGLSVCLLCVIYIELSVL